MEILIDTILFIAVISLLVFLFLRHISSDGYKGPVSDHFDGERFKSYGSPIRLTFKSNGHPSVFKWMLERRKNTWQLRNNTFTPTIVERVSGSNIKITYINHSTFLIQMYGKNILTDPVFATRVSPLSFIGPKRYRAPGIKLEDLPPIDMVLLSHNHYDHMDLSALRRISKKWHPLILTGLGNRTYLLKHGIQGSEDMDWWDERNIDEHLKIVVMPAQHFSARAFADRNKTLWMGFTIETPNGNIYFAGDTGYGVFVEKIKEKYQSFRLALIPIGAYLPPWMMSPVHISPDEAIRIHKELHIEKSIAMHHGTFRLADDGQDEPTEHLKKLLQTEAGVDFQVLENGGEFKTTL